MIFSEDNLQSVDFWSTPSFDWDSEEEIISNECDHKLLLPRTKTVYVSWGYYNELQEMPTHSTYNGKKCL